MRDNMSCQEEHKMFREAPRKREILFNHRLNDRPGHLWYPTDNEVKQRSDFTDSCPA